VPIQTTRTDVAARGEAARAAEQAVRRQTVFREVNENIARLTGLMTDTGYTPCICECSDTSCAESLEITAREYQAVRAEPGRFVIAPGHQQEGIEQVVDGNGRFLVVEKLGHAAEIARRASPAVGR